MGNVVIAVQAFPSSSCLFVGFRPLVVLPVLGSPFAKGLFSDLVVSSDPFGIWDSPPIKVVGGEVSMADEGVVTHPFEAVGLEELEDVPSDEFLFSGDVD